MAMVMTMTIMILMAMEEGQKIYIALTDAFIISSEVVSINAANSTR